MENENKDSPKKKSEEKSNTKNDRNKSSIQPFAATDSSNQTLKKGIRDSQVVQLKKDLAKLGFKVPGNGTNLYGTKTEKKVKELQKYYGSTQDGRVGKQTKISIDTNDNSRLKNSKRTHE